MSREGSADRNNEVLNMSSSKAFREDPLNLTYLEDKEAFTNFELKNSRQNQSPQKELSQTERPESVLDQTISVVDFHKPESSISSEPDQPPVSHKQVSENMKKLRGQLTFIFSKVDDPKELIDCVKKYQPISQEMQMAILNKPKKWKVKKYKNAIFYGELMNGQRQGKGVILYDNISAYEGEWDCNLKHGKGVEVTAGGAMYEGEYKNGKPDGEGIFIWPHGETYEGQWQCGKKHGTGVWKGTRGESYIGEWVQGRQEGRGVFTWRHGEKYEGEFLNFLKHGTGKEKFGNGDYYMGAYLNGKPNGYGEYYWADGRHYKGSFRNGFRHGKGTWRGGPGNSDTYDGEWANDKKCGYGVYNWKTGNVYKGDYFDDKREGYGELLWTNGNHYKGQWHKGIMHGEGTLIIPGKETLVGGFDNGVFLGSRETMEDEETTHRKNFFIEPSLRMETGHEPTTQPVKLDSRISLNSRGAPTSANTLRNIVSRGPDRRAASQANHQRLPRLAPPVNNALQHVVSNPNRTMDAGNNNNDVLPLLIEHSKGGGQDYSDDRSHICPKCKMMNGTKHGSVRGGGRKVNLTDTYFKMPGSTKTTKGPRGISADDCKNCANEVKLNLYPPPVLAPVPAYVERLSPTQFPTSAYLSKHEVARWLVIKEKLHLTSRHYDDLNNSQVCERIRKFLQPKVWKPADNSKVIRGRSVISGHLAVFS